MSNLEFSEEKGTAKEKGQEMMDLYGDLMRQGKYVEAATLFLDYSQIDPFTLRDISPIRTITGSPFPTIVCLCGSTRFYESFQEANFKETMAGRIVLSVGFYAHRPEMIPIHGETVGITPEQKKMLDNLHLRKIDLCHEVLVLNVDGYIGDSTAREIEYAVHQGKPVRFLEPPVS